MSSRLSKSGAIIQGTKAALLVSAYAVIASGQTSIPKPTAVKSKTIAVPRPGTDPKKIVAAATKPCTDCPDLTLGPCEVRCYNGGLYSTELCANSGYRGDFTFMAIPMPTLKNQGTKAATFAGGARFWSAEGISAQSGTSPSTGLLLDPGSQVPGSLVPTQTFQGLNPGSYKVVFRADPDNLVRESDESNNVSECNFTVTPAPTASSVDLAITAVSIAPATGVGTTNFAHTVTVKNVGNQDSASFNTHCEPGASWNRLGLKAGESATVTYAIPNVSFIPPGTHSVKCSVSHQAAEDNLTNNSASARFTIAASSTTASNATPAKGDLALGPCEVRCYNGGTYSTALCASSGYRSDFTFMAIPLPTLKNVGSGSVTFPAAAKLWSIDGQNPSSSLAPSTGLLLSAGAEVPGSLKPSKTLSDLKPGSYKVTFRADPDGSIGEANEANNVSECSWTVVPAPASSAADLTITSVTVSPRSGNASTQFKHSVTIKNIGTEESGGFNTRCEPGVGWNQPSLKAGASMTVTYPIPNIASMPKASHSVICTISPFFAEQNTANNTGSASFTIVP